MNNEKSIVQKKDFIKSRRIIIILSKKIIYTLNVALGCRRLIP